MKPVALFAVSHLTVTQFETRRRQLEAERELVDARASARRGDAAERPRRARRLLRAVRGATA